MPSINDMQDNNDRTKSGMLKRSPAVHDLTIIPESANFSIDLNVRLAWTSTPKIIPMTLENFHTMKMIKQSLIGVLPRGVGLDRVQLIVVKKDSAELVVDEFKHLFEFEMVDGDELRIEIKEA
ncbi:hypothetical protein BKA69DRAFT_1041379 [Paraphysoderma sedebokerense]|nr:hypothetical protein BKA69DRAFT_1041379 [Paraphysoderma sedebokerense]